MTPFSRPALFPTARTVSRALRIVPRVLQFVPRSKLKSLNGEQGFSTDAFLKADAKRRHVLVQLLSRDAIPLFNASDVHKRTEICHRLFYSSP